MWNRSSKLYYKKDLLDTYRLERVNFETFGNLLLTTLATGRQKNAHFWLGYADCLAGAN